MSDPFGGLFGKNYRFPQPPAPAKPEKPEKGVPWEAKIIDGEYYVPLRQVGDLLAANDALPKVRKGIQARVESKRHES